MVAQGTTNADPSDIPALADFGTTRLYPAAALVALGYDYVGAVRVGPATAEFLFDGDADELSALQGLYYRGALPPVQPRAFADALKELRANALAVCAWPGSGPHTT